jgi:hypothetical protein
MSKIPWYIIAVLLGVIILQRSCGPGKCPEVQPVKVVKSDTTFIRLHDTLHEVKLVPVTKIVETHPEPITITDTVFLTTIEPVDTIEILKDYFATRYYADTNHLETYGNFIIEDAISQNKIKSRQIIYNLNIPEVSKTAIIKPRNQLYFGLDLGGTNSWISFGPQLVLKTASDKMYHAGVSFTSENKFYFHLGTDWKIHF